MREVLEALDRESAFQTLGRFDLLAGDHLPYVDLGAPDVDGELRKGIEGAEGVITVVGRMGSGKSSLIAAVADSLDEGFAPLRVSVIGVEAGSPTAFARHAITEIRDLPETHLNRHEKLALDRAAAERQMTTTRRVLRGGFEVGSGGVFTGKVVADIKRAAGEELERNTASGTVVRGIERLLDVFWKLKRCPVVIIEDTDHWSSSLPSRNPSPPTPKTSKPGFSSSAATHPASAPSAPTARSSTGLWSRCCCAPSWRSPRNRRLVPTSRS
jgi:hypothetical protein